VTSFQDRLDSVLCRAALKLAIPIVGVDYVEKCIENGCMLPMPCDISFKKRKCKFKLQAFCYFCYYSVNISKTVN
jgi:hypothetical protein